MLSPANLAGLGAIALWAFLALLSRLASGVPPLELTALAFTLSSLLGMGVVGLRGGFGVLRQPVLVWAHGVLGLFGYHALYFAALAWAPAAEANLINYLWPLLIVVLAAPVLGLRLTWKHALGAAMAALGCLLLMGPGVALKREALLGYGFAAGAALTWALYSVLSRRLSAVPTEALAGFCTASALLAWAASALFETFVMPSALAWLGLLVMGVGPLGGAFFLWDIGMKQGDPRLLGTLAFATPVVSTLLLCLGGFTPLSLTLLAAAGLVTAGGFIASRS
jgi:drug/metabolite transporter (DMT)-like permease